MAVGTLKLVKSLLVNGKNVYEVPYDFDLLTVEDITEADRYRLEDKGLPAIYPSIDRATQLEIFARAVEKVTRDIGREDLQRLGAKDGLRAANLTRDFFNAADADPSVTEEAPPRPEGTESPGEMGRIYDYPSESEGSGGGGAETSP